MEDEDESSRMVEELNLGKRVSDEIDITVYFLQFCLTHACKILPTMMMIQPSFVLDSKKDKHV